MFDGLTGMDWVFVVSALVFGFGVVKFMLSVKGSAQETTLADAAEPSLHSTETPNGCDVAATAKNHSAPGGRINEE